MAVTIVEVKRRSQQGMTRPFYCRGDDDNWYWAKGSFAGKAALCYEWLAGRVAQEFGLPIPPFEQAIVPEELVQYSAMEDIEDLGSGIVFASEHVDGAGDLLLPHVSRVPVELRQKILIFDWWMQNEDRTLGVQGGNVNLLWTATEAAAHVIDHNVAFDETFDLAQFRRNHVFRGDMDSLDPQLGLELEPLMLDISARFEGFFDELPEEWSEAVTLCPACTLDRLEAVLGRFRGAADLFRGVVR